MSIAVGIYLEPAARQLDVAPEELRDRVRAVFARLIGSVVDDDAPA